MYINKIFLINVKWLDLKLDDSNINTIGNNHIRESKSIRQKKCRNKVK